MPMLLLRVACFFLLLLFAIWEKSANFAVSKDAVMTKKHLIQLFEDRKVRTVWDEEQQKWYFSIVDVCHVLTESKDYQTARKYWNKLKQRLKEEGNETVTNCHQLKLMAEDGKMRRKYD